MKKALYKILAVSILMATVIGNTACGQNITVEAQSRVRLAYRYLDENDYTQALTYFGRAAEIDPNNADAYIGKSDVYISLGEYDKALVSLYVDAQNTENQAVIDRFEELKGDCISFVCSVSENGITEHTLSEGDSSTTKKCTVCGWDSGLLGD
ncbi:MAG: tetratricopeptide repeat protein [Lachnospiraceae bacterium]|nr:tetratricopeptide repeat protein [Lachnospiraceae bacterium]